MPEQRTNFLESRFNLVQYITHNVYSSLNPGRIFTGEHPGGPVEFQRGAAFTGRQARLLDTHH